MKNTVRIHRNIARNIQPAQAQPIEVRKLAERVHEARLQSVVAIELLKGQIEKLMNELDHLAGVDASWKPIARAHSDSSFGVYLMTEPVVEALVKADDDFMKLAYPKE